MIFNDSIWRSLVNILNKQCDWPIMKSTFKNARISWVYPFSFVCWSKTHMLKNEMYHVMSAFQSQTTFLAIVHKLWLNINEYVRFERQCCFLWWQSKDGVFQQLFQDFGIFIRNKLCIRYDDWITTISAMK